MLVHDTRVILAGVDVSYTVAGIEGDTASIRLSYSEYFKDFYRKVPEADLKSILKFEAIPVMIVTKHPEIGNTIDHDNGLVVFEGLMTSMIKIQEEGTDTYVVRIEAQRLSVAVLNSIKYTSINIGSAFADLNSAQDYNVAKVSSDINAAENVVESVGQGGLRNTDQIFIKRLLQGVDKSPEVKQPHELYANTIENLLTPIQGAVFGSSTFAVNARNFLLTGEKDDSNFFLGIARINEITKQETSDEDTMEDSSPEEIKTSLADAIYGEIGGDYFKGTPSNGAFSDLKTVMGVWSQEILSKEEQQLQEKFSSTEDDSISGEVGVEDNKIISNFKSLVDLILKYKDYAAFEKEFGKAFVKKFLESFIGYELDDVLFGEKNIVTTTGGVLLETAEGLLSFTAKLAAVMSGNISSLGSVISGNTWADRLIREIKDSNKDLTKTTLSSILKTEVVQTFRVTFGALLAELRKTLLVSFTSTASVWGMHDLKVQQDGVGGERQRAYKRFNLLEVLTTKKFYDEALVKDLLPVWRRKELFRGAVTNLIDVWSTSLNSTMRIDLRAFLEGSEEGLLTQLMTLLRSFVEDESNDTLIDSVIAPIGKGMEKVNKGTPNSLIKKLSTFVRQWDKDGSGNPKLNENDAQEKYLATLKGFARQAQIYFHVNVKLGKETDDISYNYDYFRKIIEEGDAGTTLATSANGYTFNKQFYLDFIKKVQNDTKDPKKIEKLTDLVTFYRMNSFVQYLFQSSGAALASVDNISNIILKGRTSSDGSLPVTYELQALNPYTETRVHVSLSSIDSILKKFMVVKRQQVIASNRGLDISKFRLWDYLAAKNLHNYGIAKRFNTYSNLAQLHTADMFPTLKLSTFGEYQQAVKQSIGNPSNNFTVLSALSQIYLSMQYRMATLRNAPVYKYGISESHPEIFLQPKDQMVLPPKCNVMLMDKNYAQRSIPKVNDTVYVIQQHFTVEMLGQGEVSNEYYYDIYNPTQLMTPAQYREIYQTELLDNVQLNVSNKHFYQLEGVTKANLNLGPHLDFLRKVKQNATGSLLASMYQDDPMYTGASKKPTPLIFDVEKMFYYEGCEKVDTIRVAFGSYSEESDSPIFASVNKEVEKKNEESIASLTEAEKVINFSTNFVASKADLTGVQTLSTGADHLARVSRIEAIRPQTKLYNLSNLNSKVEGTGTQIRPSSPEKSGKRFIVVNLSGRALGDNFKVGINLKSTSEVDLEGNGYIDSFFKIEGTELKSSVTLEMLFNLDQKIKASTPSISIGKTVEDIENYLESSTNRLFRLLVPGAVARYLGTNKEGADVKYKVINLVQGLFSGKGTKNILKYIQLTHEIDKVVDLTVNFKVVDKNFFEGDKLWDQMAKSFSTEKEVIDGSKEFIEKFLVTQKVILEGYPRLLRHLESCKVAPMNSRDVPEDKYKELEMGKTESGKMESIRNNETDRYDTLRYRRKYDTEEEPKGIICASVLNATFDILCIPNLKARCNMGDVKKAKISLLRMSNFAMSKKLVSGAQIKRSAISIPDMYIDSGQEAGKAYDKVWEQFWKGDTGSALQSGLVQTWEYYRKKKDKVFLMVTLPHTNNGYTKNLHRDLPDTIVAARIQANQDKNLTGLSGDNFKVTTFGKSMVQAMALSTHHIMHQIIGMDKIPKSVLVKQGLSRDIGAAYKQIVAPLDFSGKNPCHLYPSNRGAFLTARWSGDRVRLHTGIDYAPAAKESNTMEDKGIPLRAVCDGFITYCIDGSTIKSGGSRGYGLYALLLPYKEGKAGQDTPLFLYGHMHPKKVFDLLDEYEKDVERSKTNNITISEEFRAFKNEAHTHLTTSLGGGKVSTKLKNALHSFSRFLASATKIRVKAGEVIGFLGHSGINSSSTGGTGAHLHFEAVKCKYPAKVSNIKGGTLKGLWSSNLKAKKKFNTEANKSLAEINSGTDTARSKVVAALTLKYMTVYYNPEALGTLGITGISSFPAVSSKGSERPKGKTFRKPNKEDLQKMMDKVIPSSGKVEGEVSTPQDMIPDLQYMISTALSKNILSVPIPNLSLPYYDPYYVDGNLPFVMVQDNDMVFTSLATTSLSVQFNYLEYTLKFNPGVSLRVMLYFYIQYIKTQMRSTTSTISGYGEGATFLTLFSEAVRNHPIFPYSILEEYNSTLLDKNSMNDTYQDMFGKPNFVFDWTEYTSVRLTVGGQETVIPMSRILDWDTTDTGSINGVSYDKMYEVITDPSFLYQLLDSNSNILIIDSLDLKREDLTLRGLSSGTPSDTHTGDGEVTRLLKYRAWVSSKLFTVSKWQSSFKYQNVGVIPQMRDGLYLDVFKPSSVMSDIDVSTSVGYMNQNISSSWQTAPLLFYNWHKAFLDMRSKSFNP